MNRGFLLVAPITCLPRSDSLSLSSDPDDEPEESEDDDEDDEDLSSSPEDEDDELDFVGFLLRIVALSMSFSTSVLARLSLLSAVPARLLSSSFFPSDRSSMDLSSGADVEAVAVVSVPLLRSSVEG